MSPPSPLLVSPGQRALWFLHQLAPESPADILAEAVVVPGGFDPEAMTRALERVVARHPALRTTFEAPAGEPVPVVHERLPADVRVFDEPFADRRALALRLGEEAERPFDLVTGPLVRMRIWTGGSDGAVLLLAVHHIISDFRSLAILARELGAFYREETGGAAADLAPPVPFAEAVARQAERLAGERGERLWAYWRDRLAGSPPPLDLPADRPRPPVRRFRGARWVERLDGVPLDRLAALAAEESATLFMLVLAAFDVLLLRHTGRVDLPVGAPTAGRRTSRLAGVVGYLVNPIVLRGDLAGDPAFRELLGRIRRTALDAFAHQDAPFSWLAERLGGTREASRSPVFQVMLSWQAAPRGTGEGFAALAVGLEGVPLELGDLAAATLAVPRSGAQLDLTLQVAPIGGGLTAALEYDTALFDGPTIGRLARQLATLLAGIADAPAARLSDLPLLAEGERRQVAAEWNDTAAPIPREPVHSLFAAQARRQPEAPAVLFAGTVWTYGELDRRSAVLARHLRGLGVGPEVRVAVALERSSRAVAALLAVLRAGGAYVPLDPGHPAERTAWVLEDCGAAVLLHEGPSAAALPAGLRTVDLAGLELREEEPDGPWPSVDPGHLAYVMYTSGSTGRPKGVEVRHRELSNLLAAFQGELGLAADDTLCAVTTFAFDIAGLELWLPLVAGARIALADRATAADGTHLAELLRSSQATVLQATPATWRLLLAAGWPGEPRLTALCGGEALPRDLAEALLPRVASLRNVYGPTETTIWSTVERVRPGCGPVPVGRPVANTAVHLLGPWGEPVPPGSVGELAIGGAGLARGYLGRPELTAERFIPDGLGDPSDHGGRLYRTGDLARRRLDGTLELLGRIDAQVKLRGFRIELGEIEQVLVGHPGVREAAVVLGHEAAGEPRLVAFLVAAGAPAATAALRAQAGRRLPAVMVPAVFIWVESLPLTPSGKVDRRELARRPLPRAVDRRGEEEAAVPRTWIEELLAGLWAELLGVEAAGPADDFFALGGHSLRAAQLVARLRAVAGVEIPLADVFRHPTPAGLAAVVEAALRTGLPATPPPVPVPRDGRGGALPLSFAQQRLWFLDQVQGAGAVDNMPGGYLLDGPLRAAVLQAAFAEVVRRHEALRTVFAAQDGAAVQVVAPPGPACLIGIDLPVIDLGALAEDRRTTELARIAAEEAARPFDLARGPLLRLRLVRLGTERHALLVTLHHIVADGWSLGVLAREVGALYAAFGAGRPSPLPELPVQVGDVAVWQRRRAEAGGWEGSLAFWRAELAGAPPVLELPADRPRPAVASHRGAALPVAWPAPLGSDVAALGRRAGATPFMVLLAGFAALLGRWSGQDDVVLGTPVAHRRPVETEGLIGFFANLLALRIRLGGSPSFTALVEQARSRALAAFAHQELPFEALVEALRPERSPAAAPLVQVLLVLQNAPAVLPALPGLTATPLPVHTGASRFDLTLALEEGKEGQEGGLAGVLEHGRDLFDTVTAARLAVHLEVLLGAAVAAPDRPAGEIPFLTAAERHQLVVEQNDTGAALPEPFAHRLFAAQALLHPDAPAAELAGEVLTYRALHRRVRRLAALLRQKGVGPEVRVALALERSPGVLVALLAVLRAGGAFVPLDPTWPAERLAFMLDDSGAPLLLTEESLGGHLPRHRAAALRLDRLEEEAAGLDAEGDEEETAGGLLPDHLAYVIYTSGSTGRPKGVEVPHRGLANLTRALTGLFDLGPGDRVLQRASMSFDASIWEICMTLGAGACLVFAREEELLPGPALTGLVAREEITVLNLPPSALAVLPRAGLPRLRVLVTGAEACPPEVAAFWRQGRRFYNAYGPTETTTTATVGVEPEGEIRLAIGRPLPNLQVHLLDAGLQPVPLGVPGELQVGGIGLARGYLGRPELTAERFLPDPLGGAPGARLYRTGDLARRLPSGEIDFLGRADSQVKVRGFRIELGEIEAVLAEHPGVAQAVAAVREDLPGGRGVVAYVVAGPEGEVDAAGLRAFLGARLPAPLVPAAFVLLAELPRQPNGKVDRRALPAPPAPERAGGPEGAGFAAPRTELEERLAVVWAAVLGRAVVGVHDDFFALGGHSLLALRLAHEAERALGVRVPAAWLFAAPTVEALAGRIAEETAPPPLRPVPRVGALPASFAQRRLWLLDRLDPGSAAYNLPFALQIDGALDAAVLAWSLGAIVRRHEALRTTFTAVAGEPVQVIAPAAASWTLPVVDLCGLPGGEAEAARLARAEGARPFDLARGPLLRTTLVRRGAARWTLLLNLHHVVSDGWSMGIFARELQALYAAGLRREPAPLPALPVQYADFAAGQREWLPGALPALLAYWRGQLHGLPALELPVDHPPGAWPDRRGGAFRFLLPPARGEAVAAAGRPAGATPAMVLLAAFQALLGRFSGAEDFATGTVVANRRWPETAGLIGFFVNTLVLRAPLAGDPPFAELLARVRRTSLGAYAHEDLPFETLVEELAPERSLDRAPFVRVLFSLLGAPLPELELPGAALRGEEVETGAAKFDLALAFWESPRGLEGQWTWARALFDTTTVRRLHGHFNTLLDGAPATPERPLSALPLLAEAEHHQILREWSGAVCGASSPLPHGACLHELFAAQVARAPDAVAVAGEAGCLSYGELEARARALAGRLAALDLGPEPLIGLAAERSPERIAALLAILQAGGAYVPLDPALPAERMAFQIADAGLAAVVVQERFRAALPAVSIPVVSLDEGLSRAEAGGKPLRGRAVAESLAYVLYTSGSTGRPKGVAVTHGNVARLISAEGAVDAQEGDVFLQLAPLSFDASTFEIWRPLLTGARLEVPPPQTPSLAELAGAIERHRVSVLLLAAGLFHQMAERHAPVLRRVRRLLAGGDVVSPVRAAALLAEPGPLVLLNCYGPTETTSFSTTYPMRRPEAWEGTVPIGRPIDGTRACLLDRSFRPVPAGAPAELYLGGGGLARGYRRRPDLTAERFVPDPLAAEPGERLYRTGDLARHLPDGALDFLGRIDRQVKIRGFRIEPGEIEAALASHPAVRGALAAASPDRAGGRRLVAWVATDGAGPADLAAHLRRTLPDFMIPSAFVVLPELPLTANGKVDRARLPTPEEAAAAPAPDLPRTPAEELLLGLWEDLLGRRVGIRDDFFAHGGHSLLATQAVARVRELFGVDLPLRALFEAPTVEGLAARIASAAAGLDLPPLVPVPRQGDPPASFAQERLWFLDQMLPESPLYNVPGAWRLAGRLDAAALERSLGALAGRHEALRTTFRAVDGRPVQVIQAAGPVRLPRIDLTALPAAAREDVLQRLVAAETRRPFDLAAGPLLRACLLLLGAGEQALVAVLHHIAGDGWSMGIFARELAAFYAACTGGLAPSLPELPVQYADFAVWQRRWLQGAALEAQIAHWRAALDGVPPGLELPVDRPRPASVGVAGRSVPVELPPALAEELDGWGRRRGATLFMTLLAAFGATLARLTGAEDLVIGSPVANRGRREIEGLIGFFVNPLALRLDLSGDPGFAVLLERARAVALAAWSHQDVPFEKLVEELRPARDPRFTPFFNVLLTLDRRPEEWTLPGLAATALAIATTTAKFELVLALEQAGGRLRGGLEHRSDLFDAPTAARLAATFAHLLAAAVAAPERPLSALDPFGEGERWQLLGEWNDTASRPPRASLPELFAAQVRRTPEAEAVRYPGETLTYRELDRRANRLARRLLARGLAPEEPVGLCVERSAAWVVGMLGILKAGGVYLPLDPGYPAERRAWMAADAGAAVVLTAEDLVDGPGPDAAPGVSVDPGRLAYVMYTSGSTGRPKGVAVPHRAVVRLLFATGYVALGPDDRLAQVSNASFDAATFEVWGALLHGGCLVGIGREVLLSPAAFAAELARERITAMFLTASLFNQMALEAPAAFRGLRHLLVGGEALDPRRLRAVLAHGAPQRLLNGYGPTESTTFACWHRIAEVGEEETAVPIGRLLSNTQGYVLGRLLSPVPLGAEGELCLGGDGLARGYHGRPELTAERFVPDPFAALHGAPGGRLYRTGDRVRLRPDGAVDFLGRLDRQVKIRGFRIEPGEAEAVLRELPGVREAAVAVRESAERGLELVGYAVPREGVSLETEALLAGLRERLPAYLVPAALVLLDALPLTPNGKLDRRALPAPGAARGAEHRLPRTRTEERIAALWTDLLGLEAVGIDDDFFAHGGHSLLATRLVSRLREAFGVELPLRDLFDAPTVAGLAGRVERLLHTAAAPVRPPLRRRETQGPAPLSFAQSRLWFLERLQPGGAAWSLPLGLQLRGPLAAGALERALAEIVRRHEVLRTALEESGGRPVQRVVPAEEAGLAVPCIDLTALAAPEREADRLERAETRAPLDLARPPVLRALLLRTAAAEHLLLLTVHHAACDGWSLGVLVEELGALYGAFAAGRPSPLPGLPVQYADFAVWQRGWLQGEALERQVTYWRERFVDEPPVLEPPADRPRDPARTPRGGRLETRLPPPLVEALTGLGRAGDATRFMALLTAFAALLGRHSGQSDLVIGSPIANRTVRETEGLIGFFVNTLALRLDLAGEPSFARLLAQVREVALGAYAHQDLPFERLVEELRLERRLELHPGRNPLFEVLFGLYTAPAAPAGGWRGLSLAPARRSAEAATFELTAMLFEAADGVTLALHYDASLFDATTIARLAGQYVALLAGIAAAPERALADLEILGEAERHQVAVEWNDTASQIPRGRTLGALFTEVVRGAPDRVAVSCGTAELTYGELGRRANRLAHALRALGVGTEVPVGLCLERSPEMVAAMMGVTLAGGAYVPLAPDVPAERLAWMVRDAGVEVVLTRETLRSVLPAGLRCLCLDRDAERIAGPPAGPPMEPPAGAGDPAGLAYVMYTSGSTGEPKPVGVSHANVVRFVRGTSLIEGTPDEVFLQLAPISFDGTTFEILAPLLNGGRTAVLPEVPAVAELAAAVERHGVTTLWLTAGLFHQMVDGPLDRLRGVRRLLAGGDVLSAPHVAKARRRLPGCLLFNGYGPTENTTGTCTHRVEEVRPGHPVPIGRPLANTTLHVLDAAWRLVPVGAAGELCLGGEGVARGYLGRPDQTAEKLIPDPFSAQGGVRLYRSGDRARRLADGSLEFLGRLDRQVKIRGIRVEPGEIEAALGRLPGVREAVVDVRADRRGAEEKRLIAWIVPREEGVDLAAVDLRAALARSLPEALVPSAFVTVAALPLTPNGKVDRRRLPEPAGPRGSAGTVAGALSPTEEVLAGIWEEVLEVPGIGAGDDFFALGGHSLLALRVASRLRETFGVEIPLRQLFEAPVLADLAAAVEAAMAQARQGGAVALPPLVAAPHGGDLPLSFAQQRLWFLDRLQPDSPFYNLPAALHLRGRLRPPVLAAVFGEVVRRHEALRTRFPETGGLPVQRVEPPYAVELPLADLAALPAAVREAEVRRLATAEARRPFRLTSPHMLRTALLRLDATEHILLLTQHHIASDGWSIGVLLREVAALYAAFVAGRPPALPPLPVQYADFALWQRGWLQGAALQALLAFWRGHLAEAPAEVALPYDRPHPPVQTFRGAIRLRPLPATLVEALRTLGRQSGATLFMTLLGGFAALLQRYGGTGDAVVGTPTAGRTRREIEGLIGFFVNTLALRVRCDGKDNFRALLARTAPAVLDAQMHQDLPFEKLVEELRLPRDLSRSPLFQVMLILQNLPLPALALPELALAPLEMQTGTARFELTLSVGESAGAWQLSAEHNTDLFDAATIDRMLDHLCTLLAGAVAHPEAPLADLPLLGEAEAHQLRLAWSGAAEPEPTTAAETGLHGLVLAQARRTPGRVAVVTPDGRSLTYGALAARATRLAGHLRALGAGPEVVVGVLLERSPEMVAALLAVLQAGAAYLPLDPAYPGERLAFLLADARAPLVLVDATTEERLRGALAELPEPAKPPLLVPAGGELEPVSAEEEAPRRVDPARLAYVIYTSGSTGRPKGVAISHGSAVAFLDWAREAFSPEELAGVAAGTSLCFDLSVFELFAPLAVGGRVILLRDGLHLLDLPAALAPTLVNTVPSVAAELVRAGGLPETVRTVNLAGEPLHRTLVDAIGRGGSVERILNLYGPSEDTTYSTFAQVEPGRPEAPSIGRPVRGTRAVLLGPDLRLLPAGLPGELCLAGAGLARGYLGRPELTAERFVPDPFGPPGSRLYRTGDRARWRPDGSLELLGRIDFQVKIRGFRIEPGEIEAVLAEHPRVREVAVAARTSGGLGLRLIAWVVLETAETAPEGAELRTWLAKRLPAPLVPAAFVPLDRLPLSPNGKVDRRALPDPEAGAPGGAALEPPRDDVERAVAAVWCEVLEREAVGLHESFFEIGGHSLLAVRAAGRLQEVLGRKVSVLEIFEHPTVARLAAALAVPPAGGEVEDARLGASRDRATARRDVLRRRGAPRRKTVDHDGDEEASDGA